MGMAVPPVSQPDPCLALAFSVTPRPPPSQGRESSAATAVKRCEPIDRRQRTAQGGDLLLLAVAGPVIADVSLFGGRGRVWAALLGALVIGSISNGMDLLALASSVKFMVTGGVLLAAVAVDALARKRRRAHGRI
jgi:hypothetical protein